MDLRNKKVTVVGLGNSGIGSVRLLYSEGAVVSVTDSADTECVRKNKALLKEKNNRLLVKCDSSIEVGNRLMSRFGMLGQDDCSLPLRSYV